MVASLVQALVSTHLRREIANQPAFDKADRRPFLNLSSNELHHPEIKAIHQEFASEIPRLTELTKYPVFVEAEKLLCQMADLPIGCCAFSPGSDPAIRALIEAVTRTGKIISVSPTYRAYTDYPSAFGGEFLAVSLRPEETAMARLNELMQRLPPALIVLANPDGTTGHLWSLEAVNELATEAGRHGSLLLIDEAYSTFAPIDHTCLILRHANVLVVRSYSKSHGVAGLRLAAVFAQQQLIDGFLRTRISNGVSSVALAFLNFALQKRGKFQAIVDDIVAWRTAYETSLRVRVPTLRVAESKANFIFCDFGKANDAANHHALLETKGFHVRSIKIDSTSTHALRITVVEPNLMTPVLDQLSSHSP